MIDNEWYGTHFINSSFFMYGFHVLGCHIPRWMGKAGSVKRVATPKNSANNKICINSIETHSVCQLQIILILHRGNNSNFKTNITSRTIVIY